jgi:hypothetical protein
MLCGLGLALPVLAADKDQTVKANDVKELKITVVPAEPAAPTVSLTLGPRTGKVVPFKKGLAHTGGGNIDVAQPTADTVVVTLTGSAVATGSPVCPAMASLDFDLEQCLEVVFESKDVKAAKLVIEGTVIGLLRSHGHGDFAEASNATASVLCGPAELITLSLPPQSVGGKQGLSVNEKAGPLEVPVVAGKLTLHQTFHIAAQACLALAPCHPASAEFADGALDPLWLGHCEPFYGAAKKAFGFQVTLRVVPVDLPEGNGGEKLP